MTATVLFFASALVGGGTVDTLVPLGATWSYLDDGSDAGTAWRDPLFDDGAWSTGAAPLGYGDGDEATIVDFGPDPLDKYVTTYFRTSFEVALPAAVLALDLDLLRDDGAVVYVNGVEVVRTNMLPFIEVPYHLHATSDIEGDAENEVRTHAIPVSVLVAGTNVVAVEVHQHEAASDDLGFDLALRAGSDVTVSRGPYLQIGTPNGVTVRWRSSSDTIGKLWWGTDPAELVESIEGTAGIEHELRIEGLTPESTYYYAVGFDTTVLAGGDEQHVYRTPPAIGEARPFRAWVLGDSGAANANAAAVRDAYQSFNGPETPTDLWLMLGDNAYEIGTDTEYQAALFDMYPDMLASTVLWPARGNHDIVDDYFDLFTLPTQAEAGGMASGTESYYSFDYANVHFVCLDSFLSDPYEGDPMWSWLQADLQSTDQDWIVAYWHHPPYSKGSHDSDIEPALINFRETFVPLLEDYGVDLVMAGHSHSYERSYLIDGHHGLSDTFDPATMKLDPGDGREGSDGAYHKVPIPHAGAVYCVAGVGSVISGGTLDHPVMVHSVDMLGSVVLDVDGEHMRVSFIDSTGAVEDEFTIVNHGLAGLTVDTTRLSLTQGGSQSLEMDAGPAHQGENYALLGSWTGTSPGVVLGWLTVPLVPDNYTLVTAEGPAFLAPSIGVLDTEGKATTAFVLPPGVSPAFAGLTAFHAFIAFDAMLQPLFASGAVPLTFVP